MIIRQHLSVVGSDSWESKKKAALAMRRLKDREYRRRNPEKQREHQRRFREKNKERLAQYKRDWKAKNKQHLRDYYRVRYYKLHEKRRPYLTEYNRKRREAMGAR